MDYPCNFIYHPIDRIVSWDGVTGAIEYQIEVSTDLVNWEIIYQGGVNLSVPFIHPAGLYHIKGKAGKGGGWGVYGQIEEIDVPVS